MNARDVAKYLGVHINTIKKLPDLPFYIVNARGDRRYRKTEVETWLKTRRMTNEGN
jgi:tRNA A-37 threonylcarbamoyl transferase component Bud32